MNIHVGRQYRFHSTRRNPDPRREGAIVEVVAGDESYQVWPMTAPEMTYQIRFPENVREPRENTYQAWERELHPLA